MLATHDWCGHEADVATCFLKKIRAYKVQVEAVELESFFANIAGIVGSWGCLTWRPRRQQ